MRQQLALDPFKQPPPVIDTGQDDWKWSNPLGLHQGHHLHPLIKGSETTWKQHHRVRFFQKRDLAVEKILVVDVTRIALHDGIGFLLEGQIDVEAHRYAAGLGRPYADKDRQEQIIVESDLDWTIVRPVILTNNGKSGKLKVLRDPSEWRNGVVPRADVAAYLVDAVEQDLDIRSDVVIAR